MAKKSRKQIYLDRLQEAQLRQLANATGLSQSEIIRRALALRLSSFSPQPRNLSAWEEELRFIKEWTALGPVAGGRTWKREDLYDRQQDEGVSTLC